jgi:CheY-like chemotaxis protein
MFTVGLPLADSLAAAPALQPRRERRVRGDRRVARPVVDTAPASPRVQEHERALEGIHVLLVDDDKDICEVLQFVLEGQGAVVSVAASALEALAALECSMPNVLLSDIAMPGATGNDLMRMIVARKGIQAPPAAALTAYARDQDRREALASGFQLLLTKPIDPWELISAVRNLALARRPSGQSSAPRQLQGGRP